MKRFVVPHVALAVVAALGLGACATTSRPDLEPRYVAVHNAFAAMGLAQVGPIHQGALAEGREVRFPIELPAQCTTVVALGGTGVRDLDVTLLDADDKPIARDRTKDAQAALRTCIEKAGSFTLLVKMASGAGDFVAASWVAPRESSLAAASGATQQTTAAGVSGTCEEPIPLGPGSIMGTTRHGESENIAGCGNSEAKESVYKLELTKRQRVTIEVEPTTFDSVLYVRQDECADKEAEVACNDDVSTGSKRGGNSGSRGSRIEEVFDPGTYYVFVDGYNSEAGSFHMNVQLADVPSLAEACQAARPFGTKTSGTLANAFDHGHGSCDLGLGPDALHRLDLPQRARARVVLRSDDFSPVVHLRTTCTDDRSEVGCTDAGATTEEATFVGVLDPGAYTVFADATEKGVRGQYTLEADLTTETGAGVRGDACSDALPIPLNGPPIEGDTFEAKDDLAPRCAAPGAPDTVYRFEVTRRSRVTARFTAEEGNHVFALARTCTDRASDIACAGSIDEILPPGTYTLVIDGAAKGPFGRYTFNLKAKDLSAQELACRAPPVLALGQTVTGTTAGSGDRFALSCAGREDLQASGDRVFRLTLAARTHLQLLLSTPSHDGVLAIRKSCMDPPQMKTLRNVEAACNNDGPDVRHSKIDTTLDAGTYFVVVDGHQGKNEGTFTLEAKALK